MSSKFLLSDRDIGSAITVGLFCISLVRSDSDVFTISQVVRACCSKKTSFGPSNPFLRPISPKLIGTHKGDVNVADYLECHSV